MEYMDILIKALFSACGAGLLTLIIFVCKWLYNIIKRDQLTLDALSHDAYYKDSKILMAKDELTKDELENHNYLYRTYHSRGLNGTGDKIHEIIMSKPVKID